MLKKNAAQRWWVCCIDGDSNYKASGQAASITATLCKDNDNFVATADTNPTEVGTSGFYYFNLTAAETNADTVDIVPVHSSAKFRVVPLSGDRYTIDTFHAHDFAAAIRAVGVGVRATQADDGTLSLYEGMTYNGIAHDKLSFTTLKDYSTAASIVLVVHATADYDTALITAAAVAADTTTVEVTTLTATFSSPPAYEGNPAVAELRYSLIATYLNGDELIATGPCFVYQTPPTS
jgi:hypothetical protein